MSKNIVFLLSIFVTLNSFSKEGALIDQVFVPQGFDNNDQAEVIINGHLKNNCYSKPEASISKKGQTFKLEVSAYHGDKVPSKKCLNVKIPFNLTVNLGVLEQGQYKISFLKKVQKRDKVKYKELSKKLLVKKADTHLIDDYIYAGVQYIEKDRNSRTVYLHGENPTPCLKLKEITITNNGVDVYQIIPVLEKTDEFCPQVMTPFKYPVEIPTDLNVDNPLIHVRSLDGRSVNTIFPKYPL